MPASPKLKGRYELKEVLAKGGMGVVYRAVDGVMKRQVAVKTMLDLTDLVGLRLFQKECEVLASMTHPNIIEIYDVGEFEEEGVSRPYLVMPLLPGVTLDKLIRASSQRLTVERSVDIACQACRGLQAAHEKGLVHRDIKPSNIFVLDDDSTKIIDFGVAHRIEASRTAGRKGTLLYMAPEQIEMKPVSAASDIFSLGVVCYEMLARRRPFERPTESSVADAILHFIPVPASELNPAVSQAVSQAIHKAMAKQPWHRYSSAKEFAETLQKALRNEPIEIFNPARMRPRLQRAVETLERGDHQYASEIVGELEGEGHLDPAISDLRRKIDEAARRKTISQLLDTAHSRIETEEYPLALQRIYEVLQLDPGNLEALSLKSSVENKRTERDMEEWSRLAAEHLEHLDFSLAREALQRILQLRPKDARALQMLSDVERLEREHVRARQEKEQLYQAALAADQRGDVSSALSKLERVLDLDRRAPDASAPERAANYQNLYNKVRSAHESMQHAYAEAKHQLDASEFPAALSICTEQLTKYPDNALFQALKIDIEERHRQALSAIIAETDRKVEAEPDLDRRIAIVEDAIRSNPGERHFEQLLLRTREKQNLIESIVVRARMHEQQSQFSEALSQWAIVKTIYDRYPGLGMEVDRVVRRRDQHLRLEARNRFVEQADRMLESRDFQAALDLLAKALTEHPGDNELAQLERVARQGLEKAAEVQRLVAAGRDECSAGRFEEGIATLSRARELDARNPAVNVSLREAFVERARGLVVSDPSAARQYLNQALAIDPEDAGAKSLLSIIEDNSRREAVDRCVSEVRHLQSQGDLRTASEVVGRGLRTFPSEARLVQLQVALKKGLEEARRQDLEEIRRIRRDAEATLDEPTLRTYSGRLDEITRLYSEDAEFRTAAEAARLSFERPKVPVVETENPTPPAPSTPVPYEPVRPVLPPEPATPPSTLPDPGVLVPGRRSFHSFVHGDPKLWAAGAVAAVAVLSIIGAVSVATRQKPSTVPPAASQLGVLEIATSPQGAALLVNGKPSGTAVPDLRLSMASGPVEIEAEMPGFRKARTAVNLAAGARLPVTLTLEPVLTLRLHFPPDGRVAIDNGEPVSYPDGQFVRDFSVGTYSAKLSTGRSGSVTFAFEVRPEGLAVVTAPPKTKDVSALLISHFGGHARIYTGAPSADVKLDGQPLGKLDGTGLDLPNLTPVSHQLELAVDKQQRKHTIEITPGRTMTLIVDSDANTGSLLVQANEEDVAVVLSLNGKEVKRAIARKGSLRLSNLKAGKYSVRAEKTGYDAEVAEQPAEVQKGEDKVLSFQFRPRPQLGSVTVRLTPGSELFVDGNSVGMAQGETRVVENLKPGAHAFRAEKGKQFQPRQETLVLASAQGNALDLRLTALPVPVEVRKRPADSTVTYQRAGEAASHPFAGTRQDLPEGTYTFTARANGYLERRATEHISWDSLRPIELFQNPAPPNFTLADWPKGYWTEGSGYSTSKAGAGLALFRTPLSYVQFTIHWQPGKPPAQWLLRYVNEKNYIRCEISENGFQATRISEAKPAEVIARKTGLPTLPWYTIRISIRSDGATLSLERGADSVPLGEITDSGFADSKFGFYVPAGQQLHLAQFAGRGF